MADSHKPSQSNSATASLNFKIHIPETLYLKIETVGHQQDGDVSDVNSATKTRTASLDNRKRSIKTSGRTSRGGMIFLSPCSSHVINGMHDKTICYILSSP
ncbi:MAG: hypothetical protein SWH54_06975 [Thermodesulfobacteriota bacterium]|nr:hypothetical protein [Thermodesulfobacteriota bacterium]